MLLLPERLSQVYFNKVAVLCSLSIVKIWLLKKSLLNTLDYLDREFAQLNQLFSAIADNYTQNAIELWETSIIRLITVLKSLFLFFIDLWLGTYACLLGKLIEGTVDFALDASETVVTGVNATAFALADTLETGVSGLLNVINLIVLLFTGKDESKSYLSTISEAANSLRLLAANLSEEAVDGIENVKLKVPDFEELQNKTEVLLGTPFEELVRAFKLNNSNSTINVSSAAVTQNHKQAISQLRNAATQASTALIIIFAIALFLSILAFSAREWLLDHNDKSEPWTTKIVTSLFRFKLYRVWIFMTTSYCNYILLASLILFATYGAQIFILRKLDKNISFTIAISSSANNTLSSYEETINTKWLNRLNSTASEIQGKVTEVVDTLNSTIVLPFAGTPFYKPLSAVIYCVIGRKIEKLETGLTWLTKNSQLVLPRINQESMFNEKWKEILSLYEASLSLELYVSICLICLWAVQIPIAFLSCFWHRNSPQYQSRSSSLVIGNPKDLTFEDKKKYPYPLSKYNGFTYDSSSSRYSD